GETGDPVQAPAAGIVALAEVLQVRGGTVILDHGAGVLSGYFHLQSIAVREGETVEPGTLLGEIGSTGLSTGSHLHWEMRIGGIAVDPREWLERPMD
ncbi:MAG: M23 family metallopeptidase, partial [Chloroflexi bacterium]|nr:M23 family metallopeptidase [Chloroflexota bacterium]